MAETAKIKQPSTNQIAHVPNIRLFCTDFFCERCQVRKLFLSNKSKLHKEHIILTWGRQDSGPLGEACKALWVENGCCFTLPEDI